MKLMLVSSSSGSHGGGEPYFVHLARGLIQRGHSVDLWIADHPRMDGIADQLPAECQLRRIKYTNTYDRKTRVIGAVLDRGTRRRLADNFRKTRPDLIHINKQNLEDGLDLLLAASDTQIPSVATIHITRTMAELNATAGVVRDWWTRRVLEVSRCRLLAISTQCQRDLTRFLRGGPEILLALNGVPDVELADRERVRARFGFDKQDIVIGTLARLEAQKNPLFLLSVLQSLPEHCKLLWVGDGSLRGQFEAEIRTRGLSDRVRATGWIPQASELLAAFDIFALPSLFEGLPFSLLEACAAGLPIITNPVEGIDDVIESEENGIIVPSSTEEAWRGALSRLIVDPQFRARLGATARESYLSRFSVESMVRDTERAYETVTRDWPCCSRSAVADV